MGGIFIEVLSHTSFFIIFLYLFYTNYVGFIQQRSMINEFRTLADNVLDIAVVIVPPQVISKIRNVLSISKPYADSALTTVVQQTNAQNAALLNPIMIAIMLSGGVGIILSIFLTYMAGESVFQLIVANLISLSIIAITDILITSLYGQFRLLDNQYLTALFALKTSNTPLDCNVVQETLDDMFPEKWIQSIINSMM